MTFFELDSLLIQHFENYKNSWEQVRMICYVQACSFSSKELQVTDILKFPWDKENDNIISKEEIEQKKQLALKQLQNSFK
jgi:hypothetical protein